MLHTYIFIIGNAIVKGVNIVKYRWWCEQGHKASELTNSIVEVLCFCDDVFFWGVIIERSKRGRMLNQEQI